MGIIKEVKDINRFSHIVLILFETGFQYYLHKTGLSLMLPFHKKLRSRVSIRPSSDMARQVRIAMEKLGPTFIKFGQILSLRPDFLPIEYIREFEKMQDKVPPFEFDKAEKIILESFGIKSLGKVFKEFDKKPVASASLAQVYCARLKNGNKVAVKVLRPHIHEVMESDISIMYHVAHLLDDKFVDLKKYNLPAIVEEFAKWTEKELDLRNEGRNAEIFKRNFNGNDKIKIPKVYPEYTSKDVLVMEFIDGIELYNFAEKNGKRLEKIISNAFEASIIQVFVHGFFHADPHPGNFFIMKNDVIGMVDFGIVGHFNDSLRKRCVDLYIAIIENNVEEITKAFMKIATFDKEVNEEEFSERIQEVLWSGADSRLKNIKVSSELHDLLQTALEHGVRLPSEFVLFAKMIATLEGLALKYNPDFNIVERSQPVIKKYLRKRITYNSIKSELVKQGRKYFRVGSELPEYTLDVLDRIRKGTVKVDIEDTDIKKLSVEMERSSGNIALGGIIAALIIGSSWVVDKPGPVYFGMNLISVVGYFLALVFGMWLIRRSIFARGSRR